MAGSAPRGTLEPLCQRSRCWSSRCLSQESLQWRHVWRHCLAETPLLGSSHLVDQRRFFRTFPEDHGLCISLLAIALAGFYRWTLHSETSEDVAMVGNLVTLRWHCRLCK